MWTSKSCSSSTNLSSVGIYLSAKPFRTSISCHICICFGKLYPPPLNIRLPFIAFTRVHDWMMQWLNDNSKMPLHKKWSFPLKISSVNVKFFFASHLLKIHKGKLYFLCIVQSYLALHTNHSSLELLSLIWRLSVETEAATAGFYKKAAHENFAIFTGRH